MYKNLMQQRIEKAQQEINAKKDSVKMGGMRQHYHLMPQVGWLNDPNGLIYFKGKYHFFFQCNPYSSFWDSMHWGHAVSSNMLEWEYESIALAPSEIYDNHPKGGCFSGSSVEHDGKLFLMYTGATNDGNGFSQTQCIAYSEDGVNFEKYEGNPVITAPRGVDADKFRDPKVWKYEDNYYMVCGASYNGRGQALLYYSKDMFNWTFFNVLAESYGEWGYMWECPDFFQIGDKYVLTFSPMGAGDHTSVYMIGDFDYKTGKFKPQICDEIDWGFDYYAPQSFLAPDGRRIMVGWSNGWEWMPSWKDWGPTYKENWCGFFNIPREVYITESGTLKFVPIKEIDKISKRVKYIDLLTIDEEETMVLIENENCFELKMKIDLKKTNCEKLQLNFKYNKDKKTVCTFDFQRSELSVNRNEADGWSKGISKSVMVLKNKDELDVHILSDKSSFEMFTNDYQNNHSNNVFAQCEQTSLAMCAYGGNAILKNIEIRNIKNVNK